MHNYKNKTYKQEKGEKKGGKQNTLGEPRGDESFEGREQREKLGHITGKDREKDSYREERKRDLTLVHMQSVEDP